LGGLDGVRGGKGVLEVTATVTWNVEPFMEELEKFLDEKSEVIAKQIARDAKTMVPGFQDKTGKLRKSIRAKKSKYADGGWITRAGGKGAMQAFLVEHGHGGPRPAQPHPYLEPARMMNIALARQQFGVK